MFLEFVKSHYQIFYKRFLESAPACLLIMVKGDPFALTLGHWIVASETGCLTGAIAVGLSALKPGLEENKFVMAGATGFITAVADLIVHPSHFGGYHTEALVTGIAAGLLCLALAHLKK